MDKELGTAKRLANLREDLLLLIVLGLFALGSFTLIWLYVASFRAYSQWILTSTVSAQPFPFWTSGMVAVLYSAAVAVLLGGLGMLFWERLSLFARKGE